MVPRAGPDPARARGPRDFKSLASTNSATPASYCQRRSFYDWFMVHRSGFTVDGTRLGAHELCTMNHEQYLEAAPGLEPGNKGFADLCLGHLATPPPPAWKGDPLPLSYSRLERGPKR